MQVREAHRRYLEGRPLREVGDLYGISHTRLRAAFERLHLPRRAPGVPATAPELVRAVCKAKDEEGLTWQQIANRHGLSKRGAALIYQKGKN